MKKIVILSFVCLVSVKLFAQASVAAPSKAKVEQAKLVTPAPASTVLTNATTDDRKTIVQPQDAVSISPLAPEIQSQNLTDFKVVTDAKFAADTKVAVDANNKPIILNAKTAVDTKVVTDTKFAADTKANTDFQSQ